MNDTATIQSIINSPDFVTFNSADDIAAYFAEDTTPAVGDKITYTGEIVFAKSRTGYFNGARGKRSMFVIVRADDGNSYTFTSAANFADHINGSRMGILARGNRVTFTATIKEVGEYKGTPSIEVTRPRMIDNDYAIFAQ